MTRTAAADDSWSYALDARCAHVKSFVAVLSAVKLSKRQRAHVRADERGVTFTAHDASKTCVASANFRADVFGSYACDERALGVGSTSRVCAFDVNLTALIDVLGAFAAKDGDADVRVRWPNREGSLSLELLSVKPGIERELRQCIYSEITPEAAIEGEERGEEPTFRDEANAFMLPTATLKEIVDDLEWPASDVQIDVNAGALRFSARGPEIGDLKIDVDTDGERLTEFTCREASSSRYKYRFLKSATAVGGSFLSSGGANGADENATMTRVAISNSGFLKIVHLLHLSRSVSFGTGGLNAFMVPVTFILCPAEEDDDHDGVMDDDE